jgi:glutamate/tyrosine decarboxylase-like PLP-dependent enzyme
MDLEIRRIPLKDDDTYEANPEAMADACDEQTILLVGSAPNFPHGIIDPIAALGEVAAGKDIWLHTDACVGGYFAPFARMNGVPVPPFDFEVPAVRSISADLHKYGYAAKGASTVLFRSEEHYRHMPFTNKVWSGAPMTTPTLAGTRPGGAISAAWAVMNFLGIDGYREKQGLVCRTRERVAEGVKRLGFEILGDPILGLIAFRHPRHDNFAIYSELYRKGWFTSITTQPLSLHLMLSPKHAEVVDGYLDDLEASLATVAAGRQGDWIAPRYS